MKVLIIFKKDSPYYLTGETTRTVEDVKEVHYNYPSLFKTDEGMTAFESVDTGFNVQNKHIAEIEITEK